MAVGSLTSAPAANMGMPGKGSGWTTECRDNCFRVVRGGSWYHSPPLCRPHKGISGSNGDCGASLLANQMVT
jgi:hypothetical protein